MKNDLSGIKNFYTIEQCKEIDKFLSKHFTDIPDQPSKSAIKTADVNTILWLHAKEVLSDLEEYIWKENDNDFQFDLFELDDSYTINHNVYTAKKNAEYSWHKDAVRNGIEDMKLTVIVNISDKPYEGGDFQMFLGGIKTIDEIRSPGSILVFPSFIEHQVTPVTKGTRKSLTLWIYGPCFR
jgi:PKHD-type hydroxylase